MNDEPKPFASANPESVNPVQAPLLTSAVNLNNQPTDKRVITKKKKVVSWILNLVALFAILISISLSYQSSHGTSGTEFVAMFLAPLFLFIPVALIYDIIQAIKVIRQNKRINKSARLPQAILLLCSILILIILFSTLSSFYKSYKFNQNISLSEAKSLIDSCRVDNISRQDNETILFLKNSTGVYDFSKKTTGSNYPELKQAALDDINKCGKIDYVDGNYVITRSYISEADAIDLINGCKLNGFYYNSNVDDPYEPIKPGADTGIILRDADIAKQIYTANSIEMEKLLPIAHKALSVCTGFYTYNNGIYDKGL